MNPVYLLVGSALALPIVIRLLMWAFESIEAARGDQYEGALGIIGIALTEIDASPTAALAERDRAIREDVLNQMEEMEVLLPIDHWGGTKKQLLVEFHKALIANARQKFGL